MLALVVAALAACTQEKPPPAPPPQIPTIVAPTSASRVRPMVDRPMPEDCELVVPVDRVNEILGRKMEGELRQIIGIPQESIARTAKIDCYHDVPKGKDIGDSPLIIGLSTYSDDASAKERVTESVEAEKKDGGQATEVEVTKHKAQLVTTNAERLLVGSLGKTTYVVRAKAGYLPDDKVKDILTALAVQSMTPLEDA
ncbi:MULTISPECIES: hypothetical protein [unclassified Saccharothrix]|uniref:hypothetical protein n=1 Tax=unclassified Saccharothrix TaxID=2593673 RepID=UPI00307EDB5E